MIVVEAALRVTDPARRDGLVAESVPIQRATRVDEPGCVVYCFAADPVEADLIQVYELWTDEASLQAHFAHPNYHAMRELLTGAGLSSSISRKFRTSAESPVYGDDRKPLVGFAD